MKSWMQVAPLIGFLVLPLVARAEITATPVEGDETFLPGHSCLVPGSGSPITCEARISQTMAPFYFDLSAEMDEEMDERVVDRVAIREQGAAEPFQEIGGVGSRVYSGIEHNGFETIDLNFDGYLDFRLLAQTSAGPNTLYRNWLWSPREGRFVANEALDEIVSPEFDPDTQEITSRWRSSAAEGGVDIHMWEGGSPVIIHRETDRYSDIGCTRTFYDRIEGKLAETGEGSCD